MILILDEDELKNPEFRKYRPVSKDLQVIFLKYRIDFFAD